MDGPSEGRDEEAEELGKYRTIRPKTLNNLSPPIVSGFLSSRKKELLGLIEKGTFLPVTATSLPTNTRVFGLRFVTELKRVDLGTL